MRRRFLSSGTLAFVLISIGISVFVIRGSTWSNPTFKNRAGESLNFAANLFADVLHTLHLEAVEVLEHLIDVPFHYQEKTYYCGPASLQMVFDFYGENISQSEIANAARTVPFVTYTDELRRAAHFSNLSTSLGTEMPENITGYTLRKLGYAAFEKSGLTLDDLKSLIAQDLPVILLMKWMPGQRYGHFRVAVGYNQTHIFLHDPWNNILWGGDYGGPNLAMSYSFFLDLWDYDFWGLLVSPWKVAFDMPNFVYVGEHFKVKANITYVCPSPFSPHEYPASSCKATITLPQGLTLADGENATKNLGNLQAGNIAQTYWMLEAERSGNYFIPIEAEGNISGFVGGRPNVGLSYYYQDRIGGYGSNIAPLGVVPDIIAPITKVDYDGLWHLADFTITITATDNLTGVAETYYRYNNGQIQNVSSHGQPWIISESANNTLEYWSIDNAGNEELPHKVLTEIKLDKTAPTMSITSPLNDSEVKSSTVTVAFTGLDETSGISHYEIRLDDGSWINTGTNTTHTFTELHDGSHIINVKANDAAGNYQLNTINFTINTSPLLGPGYIEETAITTTIIITAIGITLYLLKIKKNKPNPNRPLPFQKDNPKKKSL